MFSGLNEDFYIELIFKSLKTGKKYFATKCLLSGIYTIYDNKHTYKVSSFDLKNFKNLNLKLIGRVYNYNYYSEFKQ